MNPVKRNRLINCSLGLRGFLPLIQAPMAGGLTGSDLVGSVSNEGCLGSVGAGYMQPHDLRGLIRDIHTKTREPFNINLMVPGEAHVRPGQIRSMLRCLAPYHVELGIDLPKAPPMDTVLTLYERQLQVVIEEKVPIVSFVFGIPHPSVIKVLRDKGAFLIGTATNSDEGLAVEAAGLDAVVAQGAEAGGHRGTFIETAEPQLIELNHLLPQLVEKLSIPVIAAGGIMDGRGIVSALEQGAGGVQMGTAFLVTKESAASRDFKDALLKSHGDQTELTRAFTGKWARGLSNSFIRDMRHLDYDDIPDYPIQHYLTSAMRTNAALQRNTNLLSYWAGTGHDKCRECTVKQLIDRLKNETKLLGYDFS